MGCYLIAKTIMNYSQNRKNLKGFLGWSGFTLAILGIALMLNEFVSMIKDILIIFN